MRVVPVVSCPLGFTRVCNSEQNTTSTTAICPQGTNEVRTGAVSVCSGLLKYVKVSEPECSCLQTRVVEQDLIDGVNPLGLSSTQCYQVPADIALLHNKNGRQINKTNAEL